MTKLTQQEIEKEREDFEEFVNEKLQKLIDLTRSRNGDKEYMNWDANVGFMAWLARAEMDKGE